MVAVRSTDELDAERDALTYRLCTVGAPRAEVLRWLGEHHHLRAEVLLNSAPVNTMPNGRCWADAEYMHRYLTRWTGLGTDLVACVRSLERTMARLALEKL